MYISIRFRLGWCISFMLSKDNMITMLKARPCSIPSRMWRGCSSLRCFYDFWIPTATETGSGSAVPRRRPPLSHHTCMLQLLLQGPALRQFIVPWSDASILSGLWAAAVAFLSSRPFSNFSLFRGTDPCGESPFTCFGESPAFLFLLGGLEICNLLSCFWNL